MAVVEAATAIVRCVNPALCHLIAKKSEEMIGKSFAEIVPEGKACLALLNRVYQTAEPATYTKPELEESNPANWSYVMWPVIGSDERPLGVIVQVSEATLLQQQAAAMNQSLLIAGLRQHELTEAAEKQNVQLQEEINKRKKAEQALHHLNETLEKQVAERTEVAEARAKQLQSLAVELIEAEEKERWRISELLHEDLQQILAGAKMQLQPACAKAPPEWLLGNVDRLLEHAIEKSRSLSQDLSPAILHNSGLTFSLNWLTVKMSEKFGLFTDLSIRTEQPFLSAPLKVFIFRAVQELLSNVVHHSGEKIARIVLSGSENSIVATVSDAGLGFDPAILSTTMTAAHSGLGLLSLRERASYIGGSLDIESAPGHGSRITLTVPLITQGGEAPQTLEAEEPVSIASAEPVPHAAGEIKVLFVDAHKVMRQAMIKLVSDKPDIQIVGEAANGQDALKLAQQKKPNLVLMDVSISEEESIKAIHLIKIKLPHVRVIGLLLYEDEALARTMVQAGAECVISKTASSSELLDAIHGCRTRPKTGNKPDCTT